MYRKAKNKMERKVEKREIESTCSSLDPGVVTSRDGQEHWRRRFKAGIPRNQRPSSPRALCLKNWAREVLLSPRLSLLASPARAIYTHVCLSHQLPRNFVYTLSRHRYLHYSRFFRAGEIQYPIEAALCAFVWRKVWYGNLDWGLFIF